MLFKTYHFLCGEKAPRTKNEIAAAAQASSTIANADFWDFLRAEWLMGDEVEHPFGDERDERYKEVLEVLEEKEENDEDEA